MSRNIDLLSFGVIALALFLASFVPEGIFFTRPENLLLPIAVVLLIFRQEIYYETGMVSILVGFFLVSVISIYINGLSVEHYRWAIRPVKYLVLLLLTLNLSSTYKKKISYVLLFILLISAVVMIIEKYNLLGMGDLIFHVFTHHNKSKFIRGDSYRIIGTMMNPNNNGIFLMTLFVFFVVQLKEINKRWPILVLLILITLIFFAQSRTAIIALIVVSILSVLLFGLNRNTLFILLGGIVVGGVILAFSKASYVGQLFEKNPLEIGEFKARFYDWNILLDQWKKSKIWGVGVIDNSIFRFGADSEYYYVLATRGILGSVFYLAMIMYPLFLSIKKDRVISNISLAILLPVLYAVVAITNFGIMNVRLAIIYFVLIGLVFKRDASHIHNPLFKKPG